MNRYSRVFIRILEENVLEECDKHSLDPEVIVGFIRELLERQDISAEIEISNTDYTPKEILRAQRLFASVKRIVTEGKEVCVADNPLWCLLNSLGLSARPGTGGYFVLMERLISLTASEISYYNEATMRDKLEALSQTFGLVIVYRTVRDMCFVPENLRCNSTQHEYHGQCLRVSRNKSGDGLYVDIRDIEVSTRTNYPESSLEHKIRTVCKKQGESRRPLDAKTTKAYLAMLRENLPGC